MQEKRAEMKRRLSTAALLISSAMFVFSFLSSCNDRLLAITAFVDPCGTVFANCAPGQFQILNAAIGDACIDPECTIPGGCDTGTQPIGTIRDLCP